MPEGSLPSGAVAGTTGAGTTGWFGPCPPDGEHRYTVTAYALDTTPTLTPGFTIDEPVAGGLRDDRARFGALGGRGELLRERGEGGPVDALATRGVRRGGEAAGLHPAAQGVVTDPQQLGGFLHPV